jgi:hypothetical protein
MVHAAGPDEAHALLVAKAFELRDVRERVKD